MDVSWAFVFDSLTVSMLIPVLVVSSLVNIFSIFYTSGEPHPHKKRLFSYLSMFTFFMLVLVTGEI